MARTKNPFRYPFKAGRKIHTDIDKSTEGPAAGVFSGEYLSSRDLTAVETQVIGDRLRTLLNRFDITEVQLTLNTNTQEN